MLVRLTRLAIGRVIGDLLARTIFPATEDVREKKRTINQVEGNIVPVNDYQDTRDATKVYLNVPLRGHLYGTWNFLLPTGRHLSLQYDTEGYFSMGRTQSIDKSQNARSVKNIYLGIQKLKLTSLF